MNRQQYNLSAAASSWGFCVKQDWTIDELLLSRSLVVSKLGYDNTVGLRIPRQGLLA